MSSRRLGWRRCYSSLDDFDIDPRLFNVRGSLNKFCAMILCNLVSRLSLQIFGGVWKGLVTRTFDGYSNRSHPLVRNVSAPVAGKMGCRAVFNSSDVFCRVDALSHLGVLLIEKWTDKQKPSLAPWDISCYPDDIDCRHVRIFCLSCHSVSISFWSLRNAVLAIVLFRVRTKCGW